MKQFNVTGMSCAACSARVEQAVYKVSGVTECSVNLLTNSMSVKGTASEEMIIKAVADAGYGASLKGAPNAGGHNQDDSIETDFEMNVLMKRLLISILLLIPLMYVSMGHMLWGWPLPGFLDNHISMGIYELILTMLIMMVNNRFFVSGIKGLLHKSPNMDTLVSLGSGAAFIYSLYALFAMSNAVIQDNQELVMHYMDSLYFESAATILTLITVGKTLEARAKGKTTDAIRGLMRLAPQTATIIEDGREMEVHIEQVKVGTHFVVKPGQSIPVDGVILEGASAIDESTLTGESIPVDKKIGNQVYAGTINQSGYIVCQAKKVGEDTSIAQIIQLVSDASATKAPIAKIADRVSGVFVPVVMGIALATFVIWILTGEDISFALARAISVLVISCPCALGLATPVAIMVGNGVGAKNGIMFKTAASLEEAGRVNVIALDKTGTITKGSPEVKKLVPVEGIDQDVLLKCAYALEYKSEHPLAKSIIKYGEARGIDLVPVDDFEVQPGNGLKGYIERKLVVGGKAEYVESIVAVDSVFLEEMKQYTHVGMTPLYFAMDGKLLGAIVVADQVKDDSKQAIQEFRNMGIRVVMLTGDNIQTARAIGDEVGVDEVIAGVLPNEKEKYIQSLRQQGKVAMVGDGINDAPSLTSADVGIAIGTGTDIAIDAADVVIIKSSLRDVSAAIRLGRGTLRNIKENLFWAFFYNALGIPLAAGLWIPIFGWELNPMFGAAAMGLSSFCVVTNALRLNWLRIYNGSRDKKMHKLLANEPIINTNKEDKKMEIKVNGMMCGHCEAHVKKALETVGGVEEATADHNTGVVTLVTNGSVNVDDLKQVIEDEGYQFVEVL